MRAQVAELRTEVAALHAEADELRAHVAELRAHVDVVRATAAEGRRLGLAATRSIDVSLQAELLLRRDVDALADVGGGESTPS